MAKALKTQSPALRVLAFAPKPPSTLQEKIARLQVVRPYSAAAVELLVDEVLAEAERKDADDAFGTTRRTDSGPHPAGRFRAAILSTDSPKGGA